MTTSTKIQETHLAGAITVDVEVTEEKRKAILSEFPVPVLPEVGQTFDISEKVPGTYVNGITVLQNSYSVETTTNGGKWLKLEFSNSKGKIGAKVWDRNGSIEKFTEILEKHSAFEIAGKVEQYPKETGPKSITVDGMVPYSDHINAFELIPATEKSLENLTIELVTYLEEINEPFRSVALKGLKKYWSEFSMKPAAKGKHHAYLGGLLKHTLGLIRVARYIRDQKANPFDAMNSLVDVAYKQSRDESLKNLNAEVQLKDRDLVWNGAVEHLRNVFNDFARRKKEDINFDLLIAGIVFHDMGKILEYSHAGENAEKFSWLYPNADFSSYKKDRKDTGITMDPIGGGTGHIILSTMMLQQVIVQENIVLRIEDIGKLNHCIAAHHGKLEWGSAAWMDKSEAFLIHFVDMLDARWEEMDPIS